MHGPILDAGVVEVTEETNLCLQTVYILMSDNK